MKRRHEKDTATFRELSGADQARSISGTIRQLEQAIRARAQGAKEPGRVLATSIKRVERLLDRLRPQP